MMGHNLTQMEEIGKTEFGEINIYYKKNQFVKISDIIVVIVVFFFFILFLLNRMCYGCGDCDCCLQLWP